MRAERNRARGAEELIGRSPALLTLKSQLAQFADSQYPVLIEGESGSGKELVARSLHRLSVRAGKPYFALNCAAIAPTLVETNPVRLRQGRIHRRRGGARGSSRTPATEPCCWTKSANCRSRRRPNCCALENGEFSGTAKRSSRVSRARRSRRAIATCATKSGRGPPAPICTTAFGVHAQRAASARTGRRQAVAAGALPPLLRRAVRTQPVLLDAAAVATLAAYAFPATCARCAISSSSHRQASGAPAVDGGPRTVIRCRNRRPSEDAPGEGDVIAQAVRHLELQPRHPARPDAAVAGARLHRGGAPHHARQRQPGGKSCWASIARRSTAE